MRVVFRTDSSVQIGSGHLMRCLTLANMLVREGADVSFVCRDLPGNLSSLVSEHDLPLILLSCPDTASVVEESTNKYGHWLGVAWDEDARRIVEYLDGQDTYDLLIVDHYGIDERWESALRPYVGRIMVIDDIADRSHDCDLLLDQNLYDNQESRYTNLVPEHCRLLLGPRFALLREEFYERHHSVRSRTGDVRQILVFFGGADATNETSKALLAIKELAAVAITVDVVVGGANPFRAEIETLANAMPIVRLHGQVNNIASLMATADLAIGGGGTTTWERCFLGLPAIVWSLADNQIDMSKAVAQQGACVYLGKNTEVTTDNVVESLKRLRHSSEEVLKMSHAARSIMENADNVGTARVASTIMEKFNVPA